MWMMWKYVLSGWHLNSLRLLYLCFCLAADCKQTHTNEWWLNAALLRLRSLVCFSLFAHGLVCVFSCLLVSLSSSLSFFHLLIHTLCCFVTLSANIFYPFPQYLKSYSELYRHSYATFKVLSSNFFYTTRLVCWQHGNHSPKNTAFQT